MALLDRSRMDDAGSDKCRADPRARALVERLAGTLTAHGFAAEPETDGLTVRDLNSGLVDLVACRPRAEDGMRLWLFTRRQKPLAEADRIHDAVTAIKGNLAVR